MNKLSLIGITALAAAIVVTVLVMLRSAHGEPGVDGEALLFIAWAVSPYVCVLVAGQLFERFTRLPYRSLIFCIVSVLMLAFTLAVYPTIPSGTSSTAVIAFVAVPFDLYIGSFVLIAGGLVIASFFERKRRNGK